MATMTVKDSAGSDTTIEKPLAPGRAAAASSRPIALSTEDKAALDAVATQTTAAAILAKIIAAPATEAKQDNAITQETAINTVLGVKGDAKSTATDTTAISAVSIWKQISASVQAIATSISGTLTVASHAVTNAGTFAVQAACTAALNAIVDGAIVTLGAKADAKSTATDTTAITAMQVWKQISASVQTLASSIQAYGSAAMAAATAVTIATDDTQFLALLAAVRGRHVSLVPTCDATAVVQYDVLAATEVISNACAANDVPCLLKGMSITRLDAATCTDLRVWFLSKNSSVGAENAAFSPADADADDLLTYVDFVAADFIGTTGMVNCFAEKQNIMKGLVPASGTKDVYVAIQSISASGLDLGAATDIVCRFHFI